MIQQPNMTEAQQLAVIEALHVALTTDTWDAGGDEAINLGVVPILPGTLWQDDEGHTFAQFPTSTGDGDWFLIQDIPGSEGDHVESQPVCNDEGRPLGTELGPLYLHQFSNRCHASILRNRHQQIIRHRDWLELQTGKP